MEDIGKVTTDYYNFDEFVARTVRTMMEAKLQLCEYVGGPADGTPILLWGMLESDGKLTVHLCPATDEELDRTAPDGFYHALNTAFIRFGVPEYAAFVNEAYVKTDVEPSDFGRIQRGDIEREYRNTPSPEGISECLTAVLFSRSGDKRHSVIIYKYDDKGLPVFDEPVDSGAHAGAIIDVLDNFMGMISAKS
jgi:hypothetical protein